MELNATTIIANMDNPQLQALGLQQSCYRIGSITPCQQGYQLTLYSYGYKSSRYIASEVPCQPGSVVRTIEQGELILHLEQATPDSYRQADMLHPDWFSNSSHYLQLEDLLERITTPVYQEYLNLLFVDGGLWRELSYGRASIDNHHHQQGGLLTHSLEVAQLTLLNLQKLKQPQQVLEAALIVALLHDVGKITTHDQHYHGPLQYIDHEAAGLGLLLPPLQPLQRKYPNHDGLHLLHYLLLGVAKSVHSNLHPAVQLIRQCDAISAGFALFEQTYAAVPPNRHFAKSGDRIWWRPAA